MSYLPSPELREVLSPSYSPCPGFEGSCKGIATWNPRQGHVPRGFIGALGSLDEVQVVILVAEPGDPLPQESFEFSDDLMAQTCRHTFKLLQTANLDYFRNLRFLLDRIFPKMELEQQLRKTWIIETYLCSAPKTTKNVPTRAERGCAEIFLMKQLELLSGTPTIALGGKAQKRARPYVPDLIEAYAVARPGSNHKPARPSWEAAAKEARRRIHAW